MNPLDALSVASAITGFVDFGLKLIAQTGELYANSRLEEHAELDLIQHDLEKLLAGLDARRGAAQNGLTDLVRACREIGDQLRAALVKLQRPPSGHRVVRMARSVRVGFQTVMSREKIKELEGRLESIRGEIQFKLVVLLSDRSEEFISAFAITQQQLNELSVQAAANVEQLRLTEAAHFDELTALEWKILDNVASERDALYDVADVIRTEMMCQHYETIGELRNVDNSVAVVQHQMTEYNEHIRWKIDADTRNAKELQDNVSALRRQFEAQEKRVQQEKADEKKKERKERMLKSVRNILNTDDKSRTRKRMSPAELTGRLIVAGTIITTYYGGQAVDACRDEEGKFKPPFEIPKVKVPPIKPPKPDFANMQLQVAQIGGRIQQIPCPDFSRVQKPFQDFGIQIQKIPPPDFSRVQKPFQDFGVQIQKFSFKIDAPFAGFKARSIAASEADLVDLSNTKASKEDAKEGITMSETEAPMIKLLNLEDEVRPRLPSRPSSSDKASVPVKPTIPAKPHTLARPTISTHPSLVKPPAPTELSRTTTL